MTLCIITKVHIGIELQINIDQTVCHLLHYVGIYFLVIEHAHIPINHKLSLFVSDLSRLSLLQKQGCSQI